MNTTSPQIALPGFAGCEADTPNKPILSPFKYLEIEVTRTQSSIVYVKVPRDLDTMKIQGGYGRDSIVSNACRKTLTTSDWNNDGWEYDVECNAIKEVPEDVTTAYEVYEVK
jgi:hypothetical protein